MKKKILYSLALLWCSLLSFGQTFTDNGINYDIITATTAKVGSNGGFIGAANIPATVTNGSDTYSIISIGNGAFYGSIGLTSVSIPNSVTTIESAAFGACNGLISLTIPSSVTIIDSFAFRNCNGLTSIVIPNSVTSIGQNAFYNCLNLSTVTLSNTLTSIQNNTFESCSNLTSIHIPDSVTSIGNNAFQSCSGLTSVIGMTSLNSIGSNAFNGCTSLSSIAFSNSITYLGNNAFSFCSSLSSLVGLSGVTNIEISTFYGCSSLTSLNGLTSITDIGHYAFNSCTGLTSATIPNSVTSIGENAFENCSSLTSVNIPNLITAISYSAFKGCSALASVILPNSVVSIENYAFMNCTSLTSITIPNSVTTIRQTAFGNCTGLTSLIIPNSVTSIENFVFQDCTALTSVTVDWAIPLPIDFSVFSNVSLSSATLFVPAGTETSYDATAVWTNFNLITAKLSVSPSQTNVLCYGGNEGIINLNPSGGISPYTFNWSNGGASPLQTELTGGNYDCIITDAVGNEIVKNFLISQPIAIDAMVSQNAGIISANQSSATYQWYLCPNTLLVSETNQSFIPLTVGDYKVEIMIAGCMVTSACETVSVLGNAGFDSTEFSYYPNPVIDNLNVTYNKNISSVQIFDLTGRMVKSIQPNSENISINLSNLSSAMYIAKVTCEDNSQTEIKIFKK